MPLAAKGDKGLSALASAFMSWLLRHDRIVVLVNERFHFVRNSSGAVKKAVPEETGG
jgi:hypothetical protein